MNVTRIIYYFKVQFYDNTTMIIDIFIKIINSHANKLVVITACFIFN